jgi:hypothetical protein
LFIFSSQIIEAKSFLGQFWEVVVLKPKIMFYWFLWYNWFYNVTEIIHDQKINYNFWFHFQILGVG